MATIVKLPTAHQKRVPSTDLREGATILFFTGVRYVRDTEPDADDEASDTETLLPPNPTEEMAALAFN